MMSPSADSLNIFCLPKEVGHLIFEFIGKGSYRYVAGTCKGFKEEYLLVHPGDIQTKPDNVVGTVGCAQIYINEAPEKVKNEGLKGGNYDGLDWRTKSHDVAYWAARYGKLDILDWLKKEGNISLMPQRLYDRRGGGKRVPFDGVGDGGRLCSYYWFLENGFNITSKEISSTISHAAIHGHLALLKHLQGKGFTMGDKFHFGYAARGGHLALVRFFREIGGKWDSFTCQAAAENGHLDILKYAHMNGCDWTHQRFTSTANKVCCSAARGGHVDCLKYYCDNGGRPDPYCLTLAASGGHMDCLVYLLQKGLSAPKETLVKAIEVAKKSGSTGGLESLRGNINAQLFAEVEELVKYGTRQYAPMTYKKELESPSSKTGRRERGTRITQVTDRRLGFGWKPSEYPNYPFDRRFSKFPDHVIRGTTTVYHDLKTGIDSFLESSSDKVFSDVKRKAEKELQLDHSQKREIQQMVDADIERRRRQMEEEFHHMAMPAMVR